MKPEQIDKGENNSGYKKELKKVMSRKRRREEKRNPEDAPKKNEYRGYSL